MGRNRAGNHKAAASGKKTETCPESVAVAPEVKGKGVPEVGNPVTAAVVSPQKSQNKPKAPPTTPATAHAAKEVVARKADATPAPSPPSPQAMEPDAKAVPSQEPVPSSAKTAPKRKQRRNPLATRNGDHSVPPPPSEPKSIVAQNKTSIAAPTDGQLVPCEHSGRIQAVSSPLPKATLGSNGQDAEVIQKHALRLADQHPHEPLQSSTFKVTINEECREYRNGFCSWGKRCHRIHPPRTANSLEKIIIPSNDSTSTSESQKQELSNCKSDQDIDRANKIEVTQGGRRRGDAIVRAPPEPAQASMPIGRIQAPAVRVASATQPKTATNAHDASGPSPIAPKDRPVDRFSEVCGDYVKNQCKLGDDCSYRHPPPELLKPRALQILGSTNVCRLFLSNRCHYGSRCKFTHTKEGPAAADGLLAGLRPNPGGSSSSLDMQSMPPLTSPTSQSLPARTLGERAEPITVAVKESSSQAAEVRVATHVDGKEVCQKYVCFHCPFRNRCHRYHPPLAERHKYVLKSEEVCRRYVRGECSLGDRCRYFHVPDQLRSGTQEGMSNQGPREELGASQENHSLSFVSQRMNCEEQQRHAGKIPSDDDDHGHISSDASVYHSYDSSSSAPSTPRSDADASVLTAEDDIKSSDITATPVCTAWLEGRCKRGWCPYLHSEAGRLVHMLELSSRKAEPRESRGQELSKRPPTPLFPPGLGLELHHAPVVPPPAPRKPFPEVFSIPILDAADVRFGPGFEVRNLMTGFESRGVLLENLPATVTSSEITMILEPFGTVIGVQIVTRTKDSHKRLAKATFSDHTEAAKAVAVLDGAHLFGGDVTVQLATHKKTSLGKGSVHDGDVYIEFSLPSKSAYVGYSTRAEADQAIVMANGTEFRGVRITAVIHEGVPQVGRFTVLFRGLPPNISRQELDRYGQNQGVMLGQANYESLDRTLQIFRRNLENVTGFSSFDVVPPPYLKGSVRAWAHFDSPTAAETACSVLHHFRPKYLRKELFIAKHVRTLKYNLPSDVYDALSDDIRRLRSFVNTSHHRCQLTVFDRLRQQNPTGTVMVRLTGDTLPVLTRLKFSFETLLRGDKIMQNGSIVWDPFFGRAAGIAYLDNLQRGNPGVLIQRDSRRRNLALFGRAWIRTAVRNAILTKIAHLREQRTHTFPLNGRLIGLFMSTDLLKLQQELGPENITLDIAGRVLRVRGNDDAYQVAQLAIRRAEHCHVGERKRRESECPVCFDEVSSPVVLDCGHSWCKACLSGYLVSAIDNKVFPLTCLGDEARCSQPIPLGIAKEVLSPGDFEAVARASFLSYIHCRPSEFHYCPTPDCQQIYRTAAPDTVLQCPACLVRICPNCHIESHEGSFCPDRDSEDRKLFEEWSSTHDVKNCPGCKATIERNAGCNHMTCIRCKTHICWVCLASFARSDEVYEHMHATHGGIGL